MLYQNKAVIFWNNESLEKPDNVLIKNIYNELWVELGSNVSVEMDLNSLSFNISANNTNFDITKKWYKFVDSANHTYYYFLDSFSLHGATYIVNLTLDIWSTFIAQFFDSSNLSYKDKVYFVQKEHSNYNFFNTNLSDNSYILNIYPHHKNLSKQTFFYFNNYQSQSLSYYSIPNNLETTLHYYSYLYKVNLMSSAETDINMISSLTFLSFTPVLPNSVGHGWDYGGWAWYNLVQSTTSYDLDLVELPFDISIASGFNYVSEYAWTKNSSLESNTQVVCYFCDYQGVNINYTFPGILSTNISTFTQSPYSEETAWNWFANGLINFYYQKFPAPTPFNVFELMFPYLLNFREFAYEYMFQSFKFNFSNFTTPISMFYQSAYVYNFVPNYPALLLNIYISYQYSLVGINNLIGSFNFMSANVPNTMSVSNNFLSQNKSIIQTSKSIVQAQTDMNWYNQSQNILTDIFNPTSWFKGWTDTALQNSNAWREYSINYGSAKTAQLNKSNTLTNAGSNAGMIANVFSLTDTCLRDFDFKNVVSYIDKYGVIYEKWDSLNTWYIKTYHNFVKISNGLEKLFSGAIPNALVSTCLNMLSNGVIIWTNFNGTMWPAYLDIEGLLTYGLNNGSISYQMIQTQFNFNAEVPKND